MALQRLPSPEQVKQAFSDFSGWHNVERNPSYQALSMSGRSQLADMLVIIDEMPSEAKKEAIAMLHPAERVLITSTIKQAPASSAQAKAALNLAQTCSLPLPRPEVAQAPVERNIRPVVQPHAQQGRHVADTAETSGSTYDTGPQTPYATNNTSPGAPRTERDLRVLPPNAPTPASAPRVQSRQ